MEIVNEKAQRYAKIFTGPHDVLLKQILDETNASHPHAHMLSGHVQGKFLQMISYMIKPLKVLEIGTFTGFSALCLAAGLQENGLLHTIEIREEDAAIARKNFDNSSLSEKIILHRGNAKEIIPELNHEWDLVFLDADKVNYIDYYELTLPKVRQGGFILADNVFFHGQVLTENITGKNAKAIHAFNVHVAADKRADRVMLSVRDGIFLIRKL